MSERNTELPIVCNLEVFDGEERKRQNRLLSLLGERVQETRELEDGFTFRLPAEDLMDAAELMSLERKCCGFLRLRLEAVANEPHVWLSLSGPSGTKEFLREELSLQL